MSVRPALAASLAALASAAMAASLDEQWSLDDGPDGVILQQVSTTAIPDEYATKEVNPRLRFHCAAGGVTASIDWQRFISSFGTEVGFSVDGAKTTWLKWGVDRSNRITLSPSTDDTQALLALLEDATALQVEVSPYSEGPVTVVFDVSNSTAALDALRAACG